MQPQLSGTQKVLGVPWNDLADSLVISFGELISVTQHLIPTKHNIVSHMGKFFDPLGFLSPIVVLFKILLQDLCRIKVEWEEPLAGSLLERWKRLSFSLEESQPVVVILYCITGELSSATLCGFAAASSKAYAGVVYLLLETSCGASVKLLTSKTHVSGTIYPSAWAPCCPTEKAVDCCHKKPWKWNLFTFSSLLHGLICRPILDQRNHQNLKTVCSESRWRDLETCFPIPLEALLWTRKSSRPNFKRRHTKGAVQQCLVEEWTYLASW